MGQDWNLILLHVWWDRSVSHWHLMGFNHALIYFSYNPNILLSDKCIYFSDIKFGPRWWSWTTVPSLSEKCLKPLDESRNYFKILRKVWSTISPRISAPTISNRFGLPTLPNLPYILVRRAGFEPASSCFQSKTVFPGYRNLLIFSVPLNGFAPSTYTF